MLFILLLPPLLCALLSGARVASRAATRRALDSRFVSPIPSPSPSEQVEGGLPLAQHAKHPFGLVDSYMAPQHVWDTSHEEGTVALGQ